MGEDDNGEKVVAYILKPRFFYEHVTNLVCLAQRKPCQRIFSLRCMPAWTRPGTLSNQVWVS